MTEQRDFRRLALAVTAAVMSLGVVVATAPTTTASATAETSQSQPRRAKAPDAQAAKARQEAKQAAKAATKAEKAADAATKAVEKALEKAQKMRDRAVKSGTPEARKKNFAAWAAFKSAKKAEKKATKKAEKATRIAEKKQTVAEKKTAQAVDVKSVSIEALPAIHQPGGTPLSADAASNVVTAAVSPRIPYIPVVVEARVGATWKSVAKAQTDASGQVVVPVPQHAAYRAVAKEKASAADTVAYGLDFSDEFTRGELGPGWYHRMQEHSPESNRACSKGDPRAVQVTGATLHLSVLRDPDRTDLCPALRKGVHEGPFSYRLNGHVSTEKSYSFTYGVVAARMKFQQASEGQHSSFWLLPASSSGGGVGPEHQGAEIDVVEYFGTKKNSSGLAQFTYHNDPSGNRVKTGDVLEDVDRFLADKSDTWFDRYHVFSVQWTPNEYIFRIDGKESWRSSVGVSQQRQFIILSLLSSDYAIANAGVEGEAALGTQHTDVDWVRVWR
ncbi:glycosyl hydrolase family protein [Nocardioides seonyuensis]|uniref:Glycosyl hydrolase family protein n=1 Tax=Nocardioides seonyuensis TaxID=2518371 RepID=A0A4V1BMQ2_9ACTN|nr:glycoside hydrolase family 16 protein [Nocardioides seonyuensis]QBX57162.1 glycosyl hydrolase family protein [Nocardioides seonyuensis]